MAKLTEEPATTDSARWNSSQEVFFYPFDSGGALYYPRGDSLLVLNPSGVLVWDLLRQGCLQNEIAAVFAEHFGVAEACASSDVGAVLAELRLAGGRNGDGKEQEFPGVESGIANGGALSPSDSTLEDCGVFQFGFSRIKVVSSVGDVIGLFQRFRHRAVDEAAGGEKLQIFECEHGYRLIFGGQIAQYSTVGRALAAVGQLVLKLEHPDTELVAYCHAAAVSHSRGTVLMPGSSGVGKSTLTAFLVANGFSYLGDDIIALGAGEQSLHPLPSCLSIKSGAWLALDGLFPGLGEIPPVSRYGRTMRYVEPLHNYQTLVSGAAPAAIVFPIYQEREETRLNALPALQTMVRMVGAHATLMTPATAEKLGEMIRFVEQTPAYELTYSELPSALAAIEDLLASQP